MISLSHKSLDSVTLNVFRRPQLYLGSLGCTHGVGGWRRSWQEPLTYTNTLFRLCYRGAKSLFWFSSLRLSMSSPLVPLLYMWPKQSVKAYSMFRTFDVENCHADGCLPLMHEQDAKCHATQLFMLKPTMLFGQSFWGSGSFGDHHWWEKWCTVAACVQLQWDFKNFEIPKQMNRSHWCLDETFEELSIHLLPPRPPALRVASVCCSLSQLSVGKGRVSL